MESIPPNWLNLVLHVRVCEDRKFLKAQLPETSGSGVMEHEVSASEALSVFGQPLNIHIYVDI